MKSIATKRRIKEILKRSVKESVIDPDLLNRIDKHLNAVLTAGQVEDAMTAWAVMLWCGAAKDAALSHAVCIANGAVPIKAQRYIHESNPHAWLDKARLIFDKELREMRRLRGRLDETGALTFRAVVCEIEDELGYGNKRRRYCTAARLDDPDAEPIKDIPCDGLDLNLHDVIEVTTRKVAV